MQSSKYTDDEAQTRASAGISGGAPPKKPRPRPLDTLERVRRELASIYHQARDGRMELDKAKGLAYLLSQISAVLKAESGESELAALLAKVKDQLAKRGVSA